MRIEEISGPVQGDGGLSGARTALHNEHARQPGPDDVILLSLDGLHDVAHLAGPAGADRGEQRGFAGEALMLARTGGGEIEPLVSEAGDGPGAGLDVPPAPPPVTGRRGREVEGARRWRAPVHQQRVVVTGFVPEADPADVARLAVVEIETAEA